MNRLVEPTSGRIFLDAQELTRLGLIHRKGQLAIGEIAVAVAVASAHRAQACDACRFVIDTLKTTVPIWKKEFFDGGEVWIESPESRRG